MHFRIREGQFKYLRYLLMEGNDLVRRITETMVENRQGRWIRGLMEEMRKSKVFGEGIRNETKESISNKMKELDTACWKEELNEKSSVIHYKKWRKEIGGQEEVYTNEPASEILFKCRTNTLKLNDRKRFKRESMKCNLCSEENEDLEHFLLWCPAYSLERSASLRLQQPYKEDIIGELLFENEEIEEVKRILWSFWKKRAKWKK